MNTAIFRVLAHGSHQVRRGGLVLPVPPNNTEKFSYLERHRAYLGGAIYAASLSILFCQLGFEIFASPWLFPVTILLVLQLISASTVMFAGSDFDIVEHEAVTQLRRFNTYPSVDVFLPIAGEPMEVLHNTWTGVANAIRAYPGIAIPYVLDDGASPQAQELARRFGFRYAVRPDRPRMRKSGNLRHAYAHTFGDLIAIFDADFIPRPDYFLETVPYFDDSHLGILQTPQFFRFDRRQTWVERAGNIVQEIFYRNIQPARDALVRQPHFAS